MYHVQFSMTVEYHKLNNINNNIAPQNDFKRQISRVKPTQSNTYIWRQ